MQNAKGRLAEAYTCYTCPGSKLTDEGFSYTARGETKDSWESTPNSGGYFLVNETYWANGAVDQISALSGVPAITTTLDGEGRISGVSAASGQNPVTATSYNVAGQPTSVTLGSGDSDAFQYDPNTGRLTQYKFNVGSQALTGALTGALTWNANGTLGQLAITDPFNSLNNQTCAYGHDDLLRIASTNCSGSGWAQTFGYDPFGNLTMSGSGSFQPTYNGNNQINAVGGTNATYDANGNVENDFLHSYGWDADGNAVTVDSVNITYDALDRAVEQNRSGVYTQIVYSPAGGKLALMQGLSTLESAFVPLPGGAMAVYNSSGLDHYRHADWLGSARVTSSPSQTVLSTAAYAPFGEPYAQSGTSDLSFTGMDQDPSANAYDFPAREYGIQGRWPQPDPAGLAAANAADPQSWNRYAYVRNSPLEAIDPNGLWCDWQDGTHDDDPEDGGIDQAGCEAAGGMWDPSDTITGCDTNWVCTQPGVGNGNVQGCPQGAWACTFFMTTVNVPGNDSPSLPLEWLYVWYGQPTLQQVQQQMYGPPQPIVINPAPLCINGLTCGAANVQKGDWLNVFALPTCHQLGVWAAGDAAIAAATSAGGKAWNPVTEVFAISAAVEGLWYAHSCQ